MAKASNVFALRDALQGLAGDKGQHVADVAARVADAVSVIAQHGNNGPLTAAASAVAALKGQSKAIKATREAFGAAISAVPFLRVTGATLVDTRKTKRGAADDAAALAEAAAEAFALAWATRWHFKAEKAAAPAAPADDSGADASGAADADDSGATDASGADSMLAMLGAATADDIARFVEVSPTAAAALAEMIGVALAAQAAADAAAASAVVKAKGKARRAPAAPAADAPVTAIGAALAAAMG